MSDRAFAAFVFAASVWFAALGLLVTALFDGLWWTQKDEDAGRCPLFPPHKRRRYRRTQGGEQK